MKTIIAGSRDIDDIVLVLEAVTKSGFTITEVVSGKAPGVDTCGEEIAKEFDIPIKEFPADWARNGRAAGHIRNEQMAKYSEALIAVWDGRSPGTKNMIKIAKQLGLKVYVHPY